jgi:ParB-like chromosome segregation protein Spo0J
MNIESVPIESVSTDPVNARRHPMRNLEAIKSSLRRFGQQKPIVVDLNNVVRAGNGTLEAARVLGWTAINIVRTQLKGAEAAAYGIADNRTGELAQWDETVLAELLASAEIGDVGFDEKEISALAGDVEENDAAAATEVQSKFEIVIECQSEEQQESLHDELIARGMKVRVLTL